MINWPTAFVLMMAMAMCTVIVTSWLERKRPAARYCSTCQKKLDKALQYSPDPEE